MNEQAVAKEVILLNCGGGKTKELWRAVRKLKKNVRGTKGLIFGLSVVCLVLAAELTERKRSENYLKTEIDELKEKYEDMHTAVVSINQNVIGLMNGDEEFFDAPSDPFSEPYEDDDGGEADA